VNIAPLVGVTLAFWGLVTLNAPRDNWVMF
jgi:hypothetical protein